MEVGAADFEVGVSEAMSVLKASKRFDTGTFKLISLSSESL